MPSNAIQINIFSDNLLRGYEVPVLVFFFTTLEGFHNDLYLSRCKSRLIVVCGKEQADKIVPDNQNCSFAFKIPVSSEYV